MSVLHILIDTVEIANLFAICFQKNPSLPDDIQMANWFDTQELFKKMILIYIPYTFLQDVIAK